MNLRHSNIFCYSLYYKTVVNSVILNHIIVKTTRDVSICELCIFLNFPIAWKSFHFYFFNKRWSGDKFRAPLHRVAKYTDEPRYSVPFLFNYQAIRKDVKVSEIDESNKEEENVCY